jgi:hypothetical protein
MLTEMRRIAIAAGLVGLVACSSKSPGNADPDAGHGSGDAGANDPDAAISDAPPVLPDAPDIARPLYALSGASLYQIDMLAMTSTLVAPITSGGVDVDDLVGLGFDGTSLIGLDSGAANLLVIDPVTATVTAQKALDTPGVVAGLTVIPAHEIGNAAPIYLAASPDSLYAITPVSGAVTLIGSFADGSAFNTDLAWVHGHGLYATMRMPGPQPNSSAVDLVRIDPATAATLAVVHAGYNNINGLSGYRGKLWGVSQGGVVYAIDPGTGALTGKLFGGPPYTEAAQ